MMSLQIFPNHQDHSHEYYAAKLEENGNQEILSVLREAKILKKLEGI